MKRMRHLSIRTRLLVASIGIILIGFSSLTVFAGGQIQAIMQLEFEQHLQDEVRLLAQKMSSAREQPDLTSLSSAEQASLLQQFNGQSDGQLTLFLLNDGDGTGTGHDEPEKQHSTKPPEVETASRGEVIVVERGDAAGQETFYTAATLSSQGQAIPVVLQMAVPLETLRHATTQRWLTLGGVCLIFVVVALYLVWWLANSITIPLNHLRQSALQLAGGQMDHRVQLRYQDEIAEVGQAFNVMAERIEGMLTEQRAFASNTSHELRTPLTAIRLRTEALRYEPTLDPEIARRYIEEIDDEVIHLSDLVQELIVLAQFDAHRAEVGHEQIDIVRLAKALVEQERSKVEEQHLQLELLAPQEPLFVIANLSHLTMVFRNLLDNAIKYTPKGGSVKWDMVIKEDQHVIRHVIQDTGQGISAEALPHLFERFYRADTSHARDAIPGNGLGLAIVKSIVDIYQGHIEIDSAGSGEGTTVVVIWPIWGEEGIENL